MKIQAAPFRIFIIFSLTLFSLNSFSQYSISGHLVDESDKNVLSGANIFLYKSNELIKTSISDNSGEFALEKVPEGNYQLKISYVGFHDFNKAIKLEKNLILGIIELSYKENNISEVEVIGNIPAATISGDTIQFNADAYKTMPDASASDLVQKMPGVIIEDNKVQAQGEDVKEVLVDGRPFFGHDPSTALNALPAEVVEKIQIFDKENDQAEFTGFSTGETTKTMNIITRARMRNGAFGKIYGGYGYDNKFIINGNYNMFHGNRRITILGQTNNINQQNFASEDLLGIMSGGGRRPSRGGGAGGAGGGRMSGGNIQDFIVNQQNGITQTNSFGINYTDKWGKKIDVTGSYFFNLSNNKSDEIIYRQYLLSADSGQIYNENNTSESRNINHRLSSKIEYSLNDNNSILVRPSLSIQQNAGFSSFTGTTSLENITLNDISNSDESELGALSFSNMVLLRHKFDKKGRTISININNSASENKGDKYILNTTKFYTPVNSTDLLDQNSILHTKGWSINTGIAYTEPVKENGQIQLDYRMGYSENNSNQETYNIDIATKNYILFDTLLSNTFSNDYLTHRIGAAYNFRKEWFMVMAGMNFQNATLYNKQIFPDNFELENRYNNLLFNGMLRIGKSRTNSLSIRYNGSTRNPSISQLQNVIDNSDPLQLSSGNPDLSQSYTHRTFLRYSAIEPEKSHVFFVMLGGEIQQNYIGNQIFYATQDSILENGYLLKKGTQLSTPANMDGYINVRSFLTYGIPLKELKSNLNMNLSGVYSKTPGIVNDVINYSNTYSGGIGIVISSNISEFVDFTLSSHSNFSSVSNTLNEQQNTNYFNQRSSLRFKWIFLKSFLVEANGSHQYYKGLTATFNQNYFILNASIGKKLFKNKLGEIKLTAYDLLNQNQSLSRTVSDIYIEDSEDLVLQRFFMLTFTYNIRNFNGAMPERPNWGPPGGGTPPRERPPGGMRPGMEF